MKGQGKKFWSIKIMTSGFVYQLMIFESDNVGVGGIVGGGVTLLVSDRLLLKGCINFI